MNMRSVGLVGAGVAAAALVAMTQEPKPVAAANPAAERYAIAKEVLEQAKQLHAAGRGGFTSTAEDLRWSLRLAESAVAAGLATRQQAFAVHVAHVQQLLDTAKLRFEAGAAPLLEVAELRYELSLAKELAAGK